MVFADVNQQPRTNITTMAAAGGNCPLAPHMNMRPLAFRLVPLRWIDRGRPPKQTDMLFTGVERVYDPKRWRRNERGGKERDCGTKREVAR